MRLANLLQDFLNEQAWDDKLEVDQDQKTASIATVYVINDQSFNLYIESDDVKEWLQVYLYPPFKVLKNKISDACILINRINSNSAIGGLCVHYDGTIQYRHTVDVENSEPSATMILNMVRASVSLLGDWSNEITTVALTQTTAQEILDELDASTEEWQGYSRRLN